MITRLLEIGDQHGDVTGPARRTDNYVETWFSKMEEIRQIAIDRECHGVIYTGDMIDRPNGAKVPYWFTNRLIDHFASYSNDIVLMAGLGNHDIVGNWQSWNRQPIGAVVRAGRLKPLWVESVRLPYVEVSSTPYDDDQDLPENRLKTYGIDRLAGLFHIHVVHSTLLPNGMSLPISYTTPAILAETVPRKQLADLYVGGHIHDDLGRFGEAPVDCVNFGALTRGTIAESDLTRQVAVGLLEITKNVTSGFTLKVSRLPLKTARPVSEVFDLTGLNVERKRDERIERLVEALQTNKLADAFRLVDPFEAAEAVLKLQDIPEPVGKRVRELIGRARENLT